MQSGLWWQNRKGNMRSMRRYRFAGLFMLLTCAAAHAAPQRVISADLCSDEYVFRLVPREHIVALSWLAGDRSPVVSTIADRVSGIALIRPSAEEVLTRFPDLVVLSEGTNPRLRSHLEREHIPFIEIPSAGSFAQVREVTRKLGMELGAPGRAAAMLAEMDRTLAVARAHAVSAPVPTLIYEPNGYATSGTFADEIMAAAGLSDGAPGMNLTRSGTIPIEAVIAAAPRLLILNRTNGPSHSQADLVLQHPAFAALAGKTSVVSLTLTPLLCPGPWSVQVVPALADIGKSALARRATQP
jgi:iron complex transport system substrate-binding protein